MHGSPSSGRHLLTQDIAKALRSGKEVPNDLASGQQRSAPPVLLGLPVISLGILFYLDYAITIKNQLK